MELAERDDTETEFGDEDLDLVVAKLRRVTRDATLQFALTVGAIIIHHFYDGDSAAWRCKGPKITSFRRLARRPDLPLSPVLLYRCVATFELCDRLDAVSRWKYLNASHFRAVLSVGHEMQAKLLSCANERRWTVSELELEVANLPDVTAKQGRRRRPRLVKGVQALARCLDTNREAFDHVDELTTLKADQLAEICAQLRRLRQVVDVLESRLGSEPPYRNTEGETLLES